MGDTAVSKPEVSGLPDVQDLLKEMHQVYEHTTKKRQKLFQKLEEAIEEMNLDPNGNSKLIEAQVKLLDQSDKIMQSHENSVATRLAMTMKHKESDAQTKAFSMLTVKVLHDLNINANGPYVPTTEVKLDDKALSRVNQMLSEMESIAYNDGELKTDNKDLS